MDIARPASVAEGRRKRRILYGSATALILLAVTLGLSWLRPAAPTVEKATVWTDVVKRGPMIRQVRGTGTLVPEEIRWIPATTEGRVERVKALPGTAVTRDTVLLELSNPSLEVAERAAASELKAAEADRANLRAQIRSQILTQQAVAAGAAADSREATLRAEADQVLASQGLVAELTMRISGLRAEELKSRAEIEQKRLEFATEAEQSQVAAQEAQVDRFRSAYLLRKSQLDALQVRAGIDGVLQIIPVEVGQQVAPGTNLARVAQPGKLKAEIRIVETQARDLQIGQKAAIDTRNGIIPGRVSRIDPAAQNGTVMVDVALEGELPRGARIDLTVDGTVELERLDNVLFVGRPAFGGEQSTVGMFRLEAGGRAAARVQVKLGRSSVNTVEVLGGLKEGDQVILSDMAAWDSFDRVRLN